MSGGIIIANTANGNGSSGNSRGGGIDATNSTCTISGGTINGNTSTFYTVSDVYVSNNVQFDLSGGPSIGVISLWHAAQSIKLTGLFTGNATLEMQRNGASTINDFKSEFEKLIIEGQGYTLQASDIGNFALGSFRNNGPFNEPIGATHRLEDTGLDIGKLVPL
jgi:hypothetical protein